MLPFPLPPFGLWLAGGRGNVATTTAVGAYAIAQGLAAPTGLVTELADLAAVAWPGLDQIPFGGWDVAETPLLEVARALTGPGGFLRPEHVEAAADWLRRCDGSIRPGTTRGCGATIERVAGRGASGPAAALVARFRDDLLAFRDRHHLDTVVVVNLCSTEPTPPASFPGEDLAALRAAIAADAPSLPASTLYAVAALEAGCPWINFTPSPGGSCAALVALAEERGLPIYGSDGKTGETLMKSALAPLFAARHLRVLSWEGYNLLGNGDGAVLNDPANKAAKVASKDHVLAEILGYAPHTRVGIDYVPSLDDWKTAWDLIHFEGFLGTRMTLQFTWQGCDSALAAPLILDLARLAALARQRGEAGPMTHLCSFFKSPMGETPADLAAQFERLRRYLAQVAAEAATSRKGAEGGR
ncbi:MAG: myo-inositol-1-phosphate synthase [Nitrospirae bacterium CG18_big_fil_WC_8_21_14_2_50_70_55]|nr:myo-inositol-1-phosphate synthase [Deltaproteobacteria bacterium]OIP64533.1 MAG: hypothetical protein AUK30_06615 [Nitrospirae bacterium CG2_30_70_394]PIQ03947.1 MAG: myo-inositol-1-phosphate synthase [Nitrospirae bacterium CG18_big_fil_WC_8_21_14_2_50_70_55]PIU80116.1 MAG: myo-inositol-1-phosphate synthase [Nitrospirae bacterium CG06_land_8_20_14_3_00_70_43]PIW82028.1 MAG: myo-inositol-1-phosphate synthase [Nitrospirae bacterium CG_4_8_14_3_um_filter_70_85]PIX83922.1 MAG: myo-inositol-1-ph